LPVLQRLYLNLDKHLPGQQQKLTLTLFVLRVFAYNHDFSMALDDFAFVANLLDRRSDFHFKNLRF
jgi:hypothetical protein